eukprot:PhM_4_TR10494/c1_g1_i1/m.8998
MFRLRLKRLLSPPAAATTSTNNVWDPITALRNLPRGITAPESAITTIQHLQALRNGTDKIDEGKKESLLAKKRLLHRIYFRVIRLRSVERNSKHAKATKGSGLMFSRLSLDEQAKFVEMALNMEAMGMPIKRRSSSRRCSRQPHSPEARAAFLYCSEAFSAEKAEFLATVQHLSPNVRQRKILARIAH